MSGVRYINASSTNYYGMIQMESHLSSDIATSLTELNKETTRGLMTDNTSSALLSQEKFCEDFNQEPVEEDQISFEEAIEILENDEGFKCLEQEKDTFFLSALGCVTHKIALAQSAGFAVEQCSI